MSGGGVAAAVVSLSLPGCGPTSALRVSYPRKRVTSLSALRAGRPVSFTYPHEHAQCASFAVKLGTPAGGGVGPDDDIVAFNSLCTHQGGPVSGLYVPEHHVAGPCPLHLTTFDLTRHGLVVSGHATQSLPQVVLELDDRDVIATGVLGLMFGFSNNGEIA